MAAIAPKEAVKDSILDATDRLLARYGYRKMTVEDIASEAGIGKGTVYLHFTSKEEVVLSHIDRIVDRFKDRLREIAKSNTTAAERLRQMMLTRVLFRFDSIQHYTQSLNDLLAALRVAADSPGAVVVTIFPDGGTRYLSEDFWDAEGV